MSDIKAFPAIRTSADGQLDEFFAENAFIHIERMGDASWWIGIDLPDGQHWMINFGTVNRRAKVVFTIEKDSVEDPQFFRAAN